ncbi:MAG: DMT family transporter [Pseudorhodobacter sp.]|nr:DMT family transporter [Pseudorhodobacter sp.]
MTEQSTRNGLWLMVLTTVIFSSQDGITKHLAGSYPVAMVVMLRFWFFGAAALVIASRQAGGIRAAVTTRHPWLQGFRGAIVATQICLSGYAFARLGLIQTHAVMVCGPLLIAALSGPILGERVGWRRWAAIGVGGIGVLIILRPDTTVFTPLSLLPLGAAFLWSLYVLATRYVSRNDSAAVSFSWTGMAGAVAITAPGLWSWVAMTPGDWGWMLALCCTSVTGHFLLIKAYDMAEASALQPLTYLQLVFVSFFGVFLFNEVLHANVIVGTVIVVAAGLFTLWRQQVRARAAPL